MRIVVPFAAPNTVQHKIIKKSLLSLCIAAISSQNAFADNQLPTDSSATKPLATIIVTGTRSTAKLASESLQPIDIISGDTLRNSTGANELGTALSKIIPSINFPRPTVVDGTELVRPVQLRGLSPDQVLVLVNGKRWHTSAFINLGGTIGRGSAPADLNTIPLSAISRIEVLRNGASARYGSDAIAGVINVILKKGADHGEISLKAGQYAAGDGLQEHLSANGGIQLAEQSWINLAAEGGHNNYTNRAGADLRSPSSTTYGQTTFRFGDPQINEGKLSFNSQLKLNEQAQLYSFGSYSHRKGETAEFYRLSNSSSNIPSIYPNGYLPLVDGDIDDTAIVAGLKGQLPYDWQYDLSVNYGQNSYAIDTHTINVDLFKDTGSTPFYFKNGKLVSDQTLYNLDFSRDFDLKTLSGPLSVAFGGEYLNQGYQIHAGDPGSYYKSGSSGLAGFRDADAGNWSRHNIAEYLDLDTKITKQLSASAAVRHEDYSDFGNATTGALSARYDFSPAVAIRSSISNGFRAPSLVQQHYTQTSSQLVNGQLVEAGTFPANSKVAQLLGAEPLKAERSKNYSFGVILNPLDKLYITTDVYRVDIKNRISLSSNINANTSTVRNYLAANGINNAQFNTVRYFNNASDTTTQGVDIVANYRWDELPYGKLQTNLGYNYNRSKVTHVADNPAILNALGIGLTRLDRRERYGLLADSTPRHKLTIGNDYSIDNWTIHANLVRYGSFKTYSNAGAAKDQKFAARWLLDLSTDYQYGKWLFSLGGENIFNTYPTKDYWDINQPTGGSLPYSQFSPFGFNGAFYYGKISYRW